MPGGIALVACARARADDVNWSMIELHAACRTVDQQNYYGDLYITMLQCPRVFLMTVFVLRVAAVMADSNRTGNDWNERRHGSQSFDVTRLSGTSRAAQRRHEGWQDDSHPAGIELLGRRDSYAYLCLSGKVCR